MNILSTVLFICSSFNAFSSPKGNMNKEEKCFNCDVTHNIGDCIYGSKTIKDNSETLPYDFSYSKEYKTNESNSKEYFSKVNFSEFSDDRTSYYNYKAGSHLICENNYFENLRAFGCNCSDEIYDCGVDGNKHLEFPDNYFNKSRIGVCGYVAVQMLLSYYNTYYSDTIIPQNNTRYGNAFMPIDYKNLNRDFSPGSDHNFLKRLYYTGPSSKEKLKNPRLFQFPWLINDIMGSWLLYARHYDKNIDFTMNYFGPNNIVDAKTNNFDRVSIINHAKEYIDNGKSVILTFFDSQNIYDLSHVVVAYGYTNDGNFIVNTGWGAFDHTFINEEGEEETIYNGDNRLRISYISEEYLIGCTNLNLSFNKIDECRHIYSYRPEYKIEGTTSKFFDGINDYFCSCGKRMDCENPFIFDDFDYKMVNEYCDEEKTVNISKGSFDCSLKMYRVGLINENYLTLSAKTKGTNNAYIEYNFSKKINALTMDAGLWSNNESLKMNSMIQIEIFSNNLWSTFYNFSYDKMSKNKDILYSYCFYFHDSIDRFRIKVTTNNVENENNRGRVVLKNVKVYE